MACIQFIQMGRQMIDVRQNNVGERFQISPCAVTGQNPDLVPCPARMRHFQIVGIVANHRDLTSLQVDRGTKGNNHVPGRFGHRL